MPAGALMASGGMCMGWPMDCGARKARRSCTECEDGQARIMHGEGPPGPLPCIICSPGGMGAWCCGVVGARVGRVLVVGVVGVVGDHLRGGHGGGHGGSRRAGVRVELVVQRRARPGARRHHAHRMSLGVQLLVLGLRRTGPSAPAPASSASSTPAASSSSAPSAPRRPVDGVPPSAPAADLVPEDPADGADGGHVVLVADPVRQQLVPDLPGEDARVPFLVGLDVLDHVRGGHARLGTADGSWEDGSGLVVARQDLADAAVGHAQLPRDVAGPHAQLRQLHDA